MIRLYPLLLTLCVFFFVHPPVCSANEGAGTGPLERIISLGPINTENLYLLGVGDRIVGNTEYCVRPEAAKRKTKVGTVINFALEKVVSLQPDVIFATGFTNKKQIEKLLSMGFRVERFDQPKSLVDSCNQLLRMGTVLGLEKRAQRVIKTVFQKVAQIQEQVAEQKEQRVFLQIGTQPLYGAAIESFTNDYIELAGGQNVLGNQYDGKTKLEKIISEDPDVIIIAIMGSETGIAGKVKKKWQRITTMKAVQNQRIHIIDPDIVCSPSPETFVESLEIVAHLIHPNM